MQTINQKRPAPKKEKNFLNEIFFKYFPYWPLFLVLMVGCTFAAFFKLQYTVPKYSTSASLLLKDEKKGTDDNQVIAALDQLSNKKIIENEIEVLRSKTLMNVVVEKLHLYAQIFEEGRTIPHNAYTSSPITIEASNPANLAFFEKIPLQFNASDSTVTVGGKKYPLNQYQNTDYGFLRFVPNRNLRKIAEKPLYFTLYNPLAISGDFLGNLSVESSSKLSTVVYIGLLDENPVRGEDILRELIKDYNQAAIDDKNNLAAKTLAFVQDRITGVEKELDSIQKKNQAYKSSQGAVDLSSQGKLFLQNVSDIDQKLGDVNMQMASLEQVEKYVESKNDGAGIVPSTVGLKDPSLSQLVDKLYESELTYEKMKRTNGENNPTLLALRDQINKIRPSILENIQSQKANLQASKNNLYSTNSTFSSMLQSIPQKERELIDINRQQSIKTDIYNFLLRKREESELSITMNISDSRVIDQPQSTFFPVSPNKKLFYLGGLAVAVVLTVLFVTMKEMLNRKVLFRHEIESMTSFPIIGEIILDKSKDPVVIREGQRTFIAEQFRRLRTSLGYLGITPKSKKLLITSTLSGEGKSFVAMNLALSLALTGKKVILLEFDLANPSLSKKLDVNYDKGVSSYIWEDCEPEEVIRRTNLHENLFFLPAGQLPDNPSELLMSPRVKELLTYLEAIFDMIIIDSAPVSLLSDAYVLSPMCDATLYVIKHKYTPKVYLERMDQDNMINQLKNMGIVFNGIQSRGFTKNGYGYGYGYGYIHNNGRKKKVTQ
jgi:tyrosine-protein kinase Etk/Wzc